MAWTHEELLTAAQAALLGPDRVTDGYSGTSVAVEDGALVVCFGWRRHPRQFQVRIPLGEPDRGCWTGLPTRDAQEWVNEVSGLLMEELDTGATHWAVRRERGGAVELDLDAGPPTRSAYYVSDATPLGARRLAARGLDVGQALAAEAAGVLLVWMQMSVDNARGEPAVAHVVVVRDPGPASARVAALQAVADVPLPDVTRLVHHALCAAAEAGARRITCAFHHPALLAAGMQAEGGALVLDAVDPWPVPEALRSSP